MNRGSLTKRMRNNWLEVLKSYYNEENQNFNLVLILNKF